MYSITNSVNLNLVDSRDFMNATTLLREQYENDGISNQAIDIAPWNSLRPIDLVY